MSLLGKNALIREDDLVGPRGPLATAAAKLQGTKAKSSAGKLRRAAKAYKHAKKSAKRRNQVLRDAARATRAGLRKL